MCTCQLVVELRMHTPVHHTHGPHCADAAWTSPSRTLPCCCRAFAGYWAVAATEETAMNGSWRQGPGLELFQALDAALGGVPILAEDLGVITSDVVALR